MKIAVAQIDNVIGDIRLNKEKILSFYNKVENEVDIVVFPEQALIGYPTLDLLEKKEFRQAVNIAVTEIAKETKSCGLLFGAISEENDSIGTDIFNSAFFCFDGKIQFIQNKSLIPNYDVFDEARYIEPAKEISTFNFKGEVLGISICEDIWNDGDFWHKRRYIDDPIQKLIDLGSTILLNISASPYSFGKRNIRYNMLSSLCKKSKLPLVYTCCVGAQAELIFDGASLCFNGKGELVLLGKYFEEDYFIFDTNKEYKPITNIERSYEEEVVDALILGIKDYCRKLNFKKIVVGLSGGIDSALVVYLAVKALGKENVHTLLMPSQYSSEGSIKDSLKLIDNLGITHDIVSIKNPFDSLLNELNPIFTGTSPNVTEENLQARIRGLYLMAYSNKFGHLLLTTGNKSEIAVGYATLYGDMCGALAVIGDVYKTDVYRICNYINKDEEVIPENILNKAPSAELRPNQTDQDSLPPYNLLDDILRMYLEENHDFTDINNVIKNEKLVIKILRLIDNNEFKRKQAAPVLRVSAKSFGPGRRFPLVQGWRK